MRRALRFLLGEQLAIWQSSTLLEKANICLNLIVCFDGPATMIGLDKVTTTVMGKPRGESAPSPDDDTIILTLAMFTFVSGPPFSTVGKPKGESALPSSDDDAIVLKSGLSSMLII